MFDELFAFNRWANQKTYSVACEFSDEVLDRQEMLGPGSLRATLHHIFGAEWVWLERWQGRSPTSFPIEADSSVERLANHAEDLHQKRQAFLLSLNGKFDHFVSYRTFAGKEYTMRLADLLLHVVNHGIHHRAQVLQYFRLAGIPTKGGLDYLFYRLAFPTVQLPDDTVRAIRKFNMDAQIECKEPFPIDASLIQQYVAYGDWAMNRLFSLCDSLDDAQFDRDFSMGMGTLRGTITHIHDAEQWWQNNWKGQVGGFEKLPPTTPWPEIKERWAFISEQRNRLLDSASPSDLNRITKANLGFGDMPFRLGETMIQLGGHGTHHRAQAINMLRRLGMAVPAFDLVEWIREQNPA
jgi:uncharacterized damage-inducible protein DinB